MRTSQLVLRGALFVAMLPFMTAGSCDGGDRAETGVCPSGETCSDETPNGLHFRGTVLAEGFFDPGDVKRTAVGGTQEVQIVTEDEDGAQSPFLVAHAIKTNNGTFKIANALANAFTLRAMSTGSTMVSVVDPSSGDLFDRIQTVSAPIATVVTQSTLNTVINGASSSSPYELYAPGATGYIRLVDANELSLVDTGARIAGAEITQTDWDEFSVGNLGVGVHTLTVSAGVDTVASVPFEIAIPDSITSGGVSLTRGVKTLICFATRRGIEPVHAHFDAITSSDAAIETSQYEGCVNVTPSISGSVGIHVAAAGLTQGFSFSSREDASARVADAPVSTSDMTAGERAKMSLSQLH